MPAETRTGHFQNTGREILSFVHTLNFLLACFMFFYPPSPPYKVLSFLVCLSVSLLFVSFTFPQIKALRVLTKDILKRIKIRREISLQELTQLSPFSTWQRALCDHLWVESPCVWKIGLTDTWPNPIWRPPKWSLTAAAAAGVENIDLLLHGQLTFFFCSRSQH
jgi:hypothetical protein